MKVASLTITNFEDFFYELTKGYAITSKRLSNTKSVLNGDYYGAAEPPVRCGVSHLSGLTEPLLEIVI